MDILSTALLKETAKEIVAGVSTQFSRWWMTTENEIAEHLAHATRDAEAWSAQIQFIGMHEPVSVLESTVSLGISSLPRRYRPHGSTAGSLNEDELFSSRGHSLILGDPGSGKTTILMRMVQTLVHGLAATKNVAFPAPLVLRLREIPEKTSLVESIANLLGIRPTSENSELISKDDFKFSAYPSLLEFVCEAMNSLGANLIIDGLDEISSKRYESVSKEIGQIVRCSQTFVVTATCRSASYSISINGFSVYELQPLDRKEVEQISSCWAIDPPRFVETVFSKNYSDLVTRPLFLTQLIVLFNNSGDLPPRPSDVVRKLLHIITESWDSQRAIRRKTLYAGFVPDRKIDFLSALAHELGDVKTFDFGSLMLAYSAIAPDFGLPENQAHSVCEEVESHNGLLVKWGDSYEFSHLTYHEYLIAYYLVRVPEEATELDLSNASEILAVTCAISPNPTSRFIHLMDTQGRECSGQDIAKFCHRLHLEVALCNPGEMLGAQLVRILSLLNLSEFERCQDFFTEIPMLASVLYALDSAIIEPDREWVNIEWPQENQLSYLHRDGAFRVNESIFQSVVISNFSAIVFSSSSYKIETDYVLLDSALT